MGSRLTYGKFMKLLSVAMPHHDVNMAYCDGQQLRYIKLERIRQEKRASFQTLADWKSQAESIWKLDVQDVDDVVFSFDPHALPPILQGHLKHETLTRLIQDQSKAERLAAPICEYLGVKQAWLAGHHYSHALSTWMLQTSPADVSIVIDGLGDGRPWSVYRKDRLVAAGNIKNGSIGWGIRDAGKLLEISHGHFNDIAGKVMGLQSYGKVDTAYLRHLGRYSFEQIREVWSVQNWYAHKKDPLLGKLSHLDWVATVHAAMGEMLVEFFRHFTNRGETISYSGGVAQNVIWNSLLKSHFPKLLIPPHASDEGLSLGAMEWLRRAHGLPAMQMPGFPYSQSDIAVAPPSDQTIQRAAELLAQGKIVGWYQGHGELGPRALGNRSILMDPRIRQGKDLMNRVKKREYYRPFGASVLKEHYGKHFEGAADEFMLYACQVKSGEFPAITHVDNTCRVQLVDDQNPVFKKLLSGFWALSACPVLTNTSLNLAGKPIAAYPENAMQLFLDSAIDAMVIGDTVHCR